jgi:hypothetical protein
MEDAFGTLVWIVAAVSAVVAVLTLIGTGKSYREIGRGGIVRGRDRFDGGGGAASAAEERDAEIRQMLEGRNARRARRGEAPLDIEAEIAALERPAAAAVDDELREEVREHVIARNARRVRAGAAALDVDDEVQRQIRDLT